jgi:hypothetical protein
VSGKAAENGLAMQRVRARLFAGEKDGAHLYAFRSKREGCGNAASIGYSASGHDRNLYRIHRLRHK